MNGLLIMLASSVPGVDYGWRPMDDGQLEYIIQIEPQLLPLLADGEEITNIVHPDVARVRRFRIRVGTQSLPRIGAAPVTPPLIEPPLDKLSQPNGNVDQGKAAAEEANPPNALSPDPASEPIAHQQASHAEPAREQTSKQTGGDEQSSAPRSSDSRPWMSLVLTALVLFASVGLNLYLGWIAYGISKRYRETLRELRGSSVETG